MKYIIFEYTQPFMCVPYYKRTELKTDNELKEYLFRNRENISNIEIFSKSSKCEIKFEVNIK